VDLIFQIK